jgi:hypothetical protein
LLLGLASLRIVSIVDNRPLGVLGLFFTSILPYRARYSLGKSGHPGP